MQVRLRLRPRQVNLEHGAAPFIICRRPHVSLNAPLHSIMSTTLHFPAQPNMHLFTHNVLCKKGDRRRTPYEGCAIVAGSFTFWRNDTFN
jgi:hypothetical protein